MSRNHLVPASLLLTAALLQPAGANEVRVLQTPVVVSLTPGIGVPAVPGNVNVAPDANLKLWIYDPRSSTGAPLPTGIFIQNLATTSDWQFMPAKPDGSLQLTLPAGDYQFDTVEPQGLASGFARIRYFVTVSAAGVAGIRNNIPDSRGFHAVTIYAAVPAANADAQKARDDLWARASLPASTFKPGSPCQLLDQVTPNRSLATDISAGFPKVRIRLPSVGQIRALIVPVDFPDLNGRDDPGKFFTPLAKDVREFYLKQSYGRLAFDFDIVPNWVRLPFSPGKYGFTSVLGSGDFNSYRSAIIAMTAGQIDYSKYDAVYFLVPKEMPMAQMGYGPAITTPVWTSSGYVANGATGGADMYYNEARGVVGAQWKWMAHETGHAFGLYDEDLNHASQTLGFWSIMAYNWSNSGIEHNAWDRYLQGWLPEEQVACLAKPGAVDSRTVSLSPLVRQGAGIKAAMVPLSGSKILVMESRKNEGYDHLAAGNEGVLVYTVDMTRGSLGGGYRTQRRPGSVAPNFEDAALHAGDSVTVDGVTVTVSATSADGDTVKVSKRS